MDNQALRRSSHHSSPACPKCGHDMWLTMMSGAHDLGNDARLFRCRTCRTEVIEPVEYKTGLEPNHSPGAGRESSGG